MSDEAILCVDVPVSVMQTICPGELFLRKLMLRVKRLRVLSVGIVSYTVTDNWNSSVRNS